jgi:hypothetical protein
MALNMINQSGGDVVSGSVTIAASGTISSPIFLSGVVLHGILIPAAWTTATLSFNASIDGGNTWYPVNNDTVLVSETVAAGTYVALDPTRWRAINAIRLISSAAQTSAVTINLVCRPI